MLQEKQPHVAINLLAPLINKTAFISICEFASPPKKNSFRIFILHPCDDGGGFLRLIKSFFKNSL
jgi:hypothetical protein